MADLTVTPAHLVQLAGRHQAAANQASLALLSLPEHFRQEIETSWGPYWGPLIDTCDQAKQARNRAISRLRDGINDTAQMLNSANQIYANTDADLAKVLDQPG